MTVLDGGILVVLLLSLIMGFLHGFIREVLGIAGVVGGIVLAGLFAGAAAARLSAWMPMPAAQLVGFGLILFGTMIAAGLLGHLLTALVGAAKLSGPNRLLGGVVGLLRGAFYVVGLFVALQMIGVRPGPWIENARLGMAAWSVAEMISGRVHPEPVKAPTTI